MSFPRYNNYRDSAVAWLGNVPDHWPIMQSRRIFAQRKDRADSGDRQLTASQKHGILYQDDFARLEGQKVMQVIHGADILKKVLPGDFVISMRSFEGGLEWSNFEGSISSAYVMLIPSSEVHSPFYRYVFKSKPYVQALQSTTNLVRDGQALRYQNFVQVPLPTPPRKEQIAIAAFLDRETAKIDALVEEQQRLIGLLKEKRQAVISHAVTKGLDSFAEMQGSSVDWLGEIPKHWDIVRLRFLADIGTGDADTVDALDEGDYPLFVRSDNVERLDRYTHDCEAVLTSGDGAGVGKIYHHFQGKFAAHQRVYIFNNFRRVLGRFFYHYLSANFHKVALEGGAKSTVDSLRRPLIANFWFVVPPRDEQKMIVEHVEGITRKFDELITQANAAIHLLLERRAALISAAVTGKIDVREVATSGEQAEAA